MSLNHTVVQLCHENKRRSSRIYCLGFLWPSMILIIKRLHKTHLHHSARRADIEIAWQSHCIKVLRWPISNSKARSTQVNIYWRITFFIQVSLNVAWPYFDSSIAHLIICTTLFWFKYRSLRMVCEKLTNVYTALPRFT